MDIQQTAFKEWMYQYMYCIELIAEKNFPCKTWKESKTVLDMQQGRYRQLFTRPIPSSCLVWHLSALRAFSKIFNPDLELKL